MHTKTPNKQILNILTGITTDDKSLPYIMDIDINASLSILHRWKTEDRQRKEAMRNLKTFDHVHVYLLNANDI